MKNGLYKVYGYPTLWGAAPFYPLPEEPWDIYHERQPRVSLPMNTIVFVLWERHGWALVLQDNKLGHVRRGYLTLVQ